jgi:hypothetical protein
MEGVTYCCVGVYGAITDLSDRLLLVGALAVFLADKVISKLLCRRLCRKQYSSR